MACWCADWCTGDTTCIGMFNRDQCAVECHNRGKAYACQTGFGNCGEGTDTCGHGNTVVFVDPDLYGCLVHGDECAANLVALNYPVCVPIGEDERFVYADELDGYLQGSGCRVQRDLVTGVPWCHSMVKGGVCNQTVTACCPGGCGDATNPITRCTNLTPRQCSLRGGSWLERYFIGGTNDTSVTPCASRSDLCEIRPCCLRGEQLWPPYPGFMPSECDMRLPSNCVPTQTNPTRFPQLNHTIGGRSCFRSNACTSGGGTDCTCDIDCYGGAPPGDYGYTVRPEHHRASFPGVPDPLQWNDNEIVSKNPQRAVDTGEILDDCKYTYAAVGVVPGVPGGDAVMGVTCGRVMGEGYQSYLQPAVVRSDGDVYFTGTYRARH